MLITHLRKTQSLWLIFPLLLLGLLSGCSTNPVSYDYNPNVNFAAFNSYRWFDQAATGSSDPRINNDLLDTRIKSAIHHQLQARGYGQSTEEGDADFLINYKIAITERTEVDEIETGFSSRFWQLGYHSDTSVREYDEVTLYIDIYEPTSQSLIWRGIRSYHYYKGGSVAQKDQRMYDMVAQILAGFPPGSTPANQ